MRFVGLLIILSGLAGSLVGPPARAQLGAPGIPSLPNLPRTPDLGRSLDDSRETVGRTTQAVGQRARSMDQLIRENRREIDIDDRGAPVVRGQILAVAPTRASLDRAGRAGFTVLRTDRIEGTGLEVVILASPQGVDARQALRRLRRADPAGDYDYNHVYSGAAAQGVGQALPGLSPTPLVAFAYQSSGQAGPLVGLVDTGVDDRHPALVGRVTQQGFAPGGVRAAAHGTAAASLIGGRSTGLSAAAPGARMLVADVYGSGPTGGSADAVVRGLGWLAGTGARVINISLVGPPNAVLRAVVQRLVGQGVLLVAAVGNDGPGAAPLYPAAWDGVIGVTGVDRRGRVLPEACRGAHVDFAAPGSGIVAAKPGGGLEAVRGTSFAAPLVAGRLALLRQHMGPAEAIAALGREARDLGPQGPDRIYGRGLIAEGQGNR